MNWDERLIAEGVIWQYPGHGFHAAHILTNQHSDFYFNSDYLVCNPALLKEVCSALVKNIESKIKVKPNWIITYPPYGLNIGFCLAELLKTKFGYIKSLQEPELQFGVTSGENILLCADDLISGNSLRKVLNATTAKQAKIIDPVLVIANLSGQTKFEGLEIVSLITTKMNTWDANSCPLCASGSPALAARANWQMFINEPTARILLSNA